MAKQQAAINIVPNPSGMIAECGDGVLGWVKCIAQEHVDGWVHITIAVRPSQMQVQHHAGPPADPSPGWPARKAGA